MKQFFFNDFSAAFAKLLALGAPKCPMHTDTPTEKASAEFREAAMHGSLLTCRKLAPKADVHALEKNSNRSALHKAAFWGHTDTVRYLVHECKLDINGRDFNGDTPLHDAVRFDHLPVVQVLLDANADVSILNKSGLDPLGVALQHGHEKIVQALKNHSKSKL